jgi:hypothetical protein
VGSLPNNFAIPGPPNLSAAAPNAILPNGDLTTFFTAFLAFLTILPRKYPCLVFPYPFLKLP